MVHDFAPHLARLQPAARRDAHRAGEAHVGAMGDGVHEVHTGVIGIHVEEVELHELEVGEVVVDRHLFTLI